ncbi:MAG: hypothetical protein QOK43_3209, partial [Acidimicrobiaceae bacterium]|nr:hypothetical protein [Acidimicrobiaceae bacterium]
MTTHARLGWEERNNAYLADALAWVRARLGALVAETAETGISDERSLAEGESPDAPPRSRSRSRSPQKERPRSFLSVLFSTGERAAPKRPTPTSTSASDQRGTSRS